jgi:hypothetical protein
MMQPATISHARTLSAPAAVWTAAIYSPTAKKFSVPDTVAPLATSVATATAFAEVVAFWVYDPAVFSVWVWAAVGLNSFSSWPAGSQSQM